MSQRNNMNPLQGQHNVNTSTSNTASSLGFSRLEQANFLPTQVMSSAGGAAAAVPSVTMFSYDETGRLSSMMEELNTTTPLQTLYSPQQHQQHSQQEREQYIQQRQQNVQRSQRQQREQLMQTRSQLEQHRQSQTLIQERQQQTSQVASSNISNAQAENAAATAAASRRQLQSMNAYNAYMESVRATRQQTAMLEAAASSATNTFSSSAAATTSMQIYPPPSQIPRNRYSTSNHAGAHLYPSNAPPQRQQMQTASGTDTQQFMDFSTTLLDQQQSSSQTLAAQLGASSRMTSSLYQFLRGQQQLYQVQRGGNNSSNAGSTSIRGAGSNNHTGRHPFMSKTVCELSCKHCCTTICRRGMKAILLADTAVELFSTDNPPMGKKEKKETIGV